MLGGLVKRLLTEESLLAQQIFIFRPVRIRVKADGLVEALQLQLIVFGAENIVAAVIAPVIIQPVSREIMVVFGLRVAAVHLHTV